MGFYGDADIAGCLKDIGVAVSAGGVSSYGALNLNDTVVVQDKHRGEIHAQVPSVEVQVSAFPEAALAIDAAITVNGVNYTIRDHDQPGDGALLKLYLKKA